MPTISSFFWNPSLTPATMLAPSARASPCRARTFRSSPSRVIIRWPSATAARSPGGIGWASLPLGPSTLTRFPSTCTFTPGGMRTGFLPIRDMARPLPHVGEHFAAHLLLARLPVGQQAPGRRHDGHAHAGQDRGDLVVGHVDPPAGGGHPHEPRDHLLVVGAVLEVHAERALRGVLEHAVVPDEALVLEDVGDTHLQPGGREGACRRHPQERGLDRKSTRLNSSHLVISYA